MRFATLVFRIAGIYGVLLIAPMYFLEARISRDQPPAITHPELFYGFVGVTLAWQVAFLVISADPVRFRPLMPVAVLEKLTYAVAVAALYLQNRVPVAPLPFAAIDLCLGVLFALCFFRLRHR